MLSIVVIFNYLFVKDVSINKKILRRKKCDLFKVFIVLLSIPLNLQLVTFVLIGGYQIIGNKRKHIENILIMYVIRSIW